MSVPDTILVVTADAELAETSRRMAERNSVRLRVAAECCEAFAFLGESLDGVGVVIVDVDTVPYGSAWLSGLEQIEPPLRTVTVSRYHPRFYQRVSPPCPLKHWLRKPVTGDEIFSAMVGQDGWTEEGWIERFIRCGPL